MNPRLPQPLLDALIPDLTLYFALDLEAATALPELSPLQMQPLLDDHVVTQLPGRLNTMMLISGSTGLSGATIHICQVHPASAQDILSLMSFGTEDD